ncbi:MFS transporter [Rhodococcus sp. Eu-32]|uniref:MFS transporter n=1 Tax=Rhodococcus sp. Eu-32 TaxID=1017319 RepID=UPI000DF32240|nr:MFS transporter [Rhodococcus sp. Eu-32]RRQ25539.1 MFS transporter [Rhodococcus sp. Eu-32]
MSSHPGVASPATRKQVALAASIGNTVESYDFASYAFLATILAPLFFPNAQPGAALLSSFAVFGAAFFARPLGSLVFGPLSDRIGRKPTLVITLLVMAVATTCIGVLPVSATIGIWAPVLLVVFRLVQGLAVGGEYSSAIIYAAEFAPADQRGRMTSRVQIGSVAGLLLAAVAVLALNALLTTEQMTSWGWRIPFLLSLPMGAVGLWLRSKLGETPEFETLESAEKTVSTPARAAFAQHWTTMLLIIGVGAFHTIGFYMVYTYSQSFVIQLGYSRTSATLVIVLALIVGLALTALGGYLSDRFGRRVVLRTTSGVVAVAAIPLFHGLATATNLTVIAALIIFLSIGPAIYAAVAPVTYVELVPTAVRGTVIGVAYNIVVAILGGSALYVSQWLVDTTGDSRSPAYLLMTAAAISLVATLFIKKTSGPAVQTRLDTEATPQAHVADTVK